MSRRSRCPRNLTKVTFPRLSPHSHDSRTHRHYLHVSRPVHHLPWLAASVGGREHRHERVPLPLTSGEVQVDTVARHHPRLSTRLAPRSRPEHTICAIIMPSLATPSMLRNASSGMCALGALAVAKAMTTDSRVCDCQ